MKSNNLWGRIVAVTALLLLVHLAHQEAGDEVARDHEEHVHADVPAGEERQSGVVEHHEQDGKSA
jgi:hypothetical protein